MNRIQPLTPTRMMKGGQNLDLAQDSPRPPAPGGSGSLEEKVMAMRQEGMTIKNIAKAVGVGRTTVGRIINPEAAQAERALERMRSSHRRRTDSQYAERCRQNKRRSRQRIRSTLRGRIVERLQNIASMAIYRGYKPCTTTADEVADAFTGKCHICGVDEEDLLKRLAIDHCHETGRFRGFLCNRCNRTLEIFKKHADQYVSYLNR